MTNIGRKVLIINESEDLTFRDFKKAEMFSSTLKVNITFLDEFSSALIQEEGITFLSYKTLANGQNSDFDKLKDQYVLIFDEFDSVAFSRSSDQVELK